ncbi:MAG TPA: MBL fold metallo-hydrolase [Candidatus Limnocylindria bacterium]|nr:MBL fold metallo-hydrolase [Candidatus Limnocylindria bacterium]
MSALTPISDHLHRLVDTCNVYVVRAGDEAILIDFGDGDVLDQRSDPVTSGLRATFVTHHHRDQLQGLARAVEAGIQVWAPPVERELIDQIDLRWQSRSIVNNYDTREDRFSLLRSVPVTGTVTEYRPMHCFGIELLPLPTPGHTIGSVSYLTDVDGRRVAFTGDLIYGSGKVWSLAATMWSYGELPGVASTILSLLSLKQHEPDLLLPSHGEPITDPIAAIDRTIEELWRMIDFRGSHEDLADWIEQPYVALTPHLLHNRSSHSYSYVLLSDSGKALFMDYGYDMITGLPAGVDRAARRPWLYTLDALKRDHGVSSVDVVIPTHYHDDHVAGMNMLREVEGTQVWAASNFSDVLERPNRYDLPCLWHDPIPVDRSLPIGGTVRWEEYELAIHALPGHTEFASAISFEVDNTRVVATGDQQDMSWGRQPRPERLNYIYPGRVSLGDFVRSAELYAQIDPQLMIGGHWAPRWIAPDYLEMLATHGRAMDDVHRSLLPLDEVDLGLEGFAARIEPYRSEVNAGDELDLEVWVRNPFPQAGEAAVELVVPAGWAATPAIQRLALDGRSNATVSFRLRTDGEPVRRARIAADVRIGDRHLGQHAEALVTVR